MHFLLETLRLGLANLLLHKLRSLLTALGIIIGVGAVIAVVAIGEGNKRKALAEIEALGARNIIIRSHKPDESQNRGSASQRQRTVAYGLTRHDEAGIRDIAERTGAVSQIVPLKLVGTKVSLSDRQTPAFVCGTMPQLMDVASLRLERGRYLTQTDDARVERVAVIGAEVARILFPLADPLDSIITVHNGMSSCSFRVVGVLRAVGLAGGAGSKLVGRDLNFDVHIPRSTAEDQFRDRIVTIRPGSFDSIEVQLEEIYVEAAHQNLVRDVADQIKLLLDKDHFGKGDINVTVPLELIEQTARTQRMFTWFLVAIAVLSLMVGGIGIMNIMLASVTERTREIGIRRAMGATRKHIVSQFLAETATLAIVGGIIGVASGVASVAVLGLFHDKLEWGRPMVTSWSVALGLVVAVVVGVAFGVYPAIKASLQDPIVALRLAKRNAPSPPCASRRPSPPPRPSRDPPRPASTSIRD